MCIQKNFFACKDKWSGVRITPTQEKHNTQITLQSNDRSLTSHLSSTLTSRNNNIISRHLFKKKEKNPEHPQSNKTHEEVQYKHKSTVLTSSVHYIEAPLQPYTDIVSLEFDSKKQALEFP